MRHLPRLNGQVLGPLLELSLVLQRLLPELLAGLIKPTVETLLQQLFDTALDRDNGRRLSAQPGNQVDQLR